MFDKRVRRFLHKGVSSIQMSLVLVAIAVVVITGVRVIGTSTRGELNQTAGEVADPSSLVDRWGSQCPECP